MVLTCNNLVVMAQSLSPVPLSVSYSFVSLYFLASLRTKLVVCLGGPNLVLTEVKTIFFFLACLSLLVGVSYIIQFLCYWFNSCDVPMTHDHLKANIYHMVTWYFPNLNFKVDKHLNASSCNRHKIDCGIPRLRDTPDTSCFFQREDHILAAFGRAFVGILWHI